MRWSNSLDHFSGSFVFCELPNNYLSFMTDACEYADSSFIYSATLTLLSANSHIGQIRAPVPLLPLVVIN